MHSNVSKNSVTQYCVIRRESVNTPYLLCVDKVITSRSEMRDNLPYEIINSIILRDTQCEQTRGLMVT